MRDSDKGNIRLLAECKAKGERAVGAQIADEKVRKRLAVFLGFGVAAATGVRTDFRLDDYTVTVNDGMAVTFGLRLRYFVFGADETTLDARRPVMGKHDEHARARDDIRIVGMTHGVDAISASSAPKRLSTSSGSYSAVFQSSVSWLNVPSAA
ncbi:hypothetical protein FKO01_45815 [Mesorhizobium sp. B2-3-3]|nr:hypothetical protein FKO01_45815 [Mesorhizobium sp. B2-3-3]